MGTDAFIFREQGILSNYFQCTREILIKLFRSRELQYALNYNFSLSFQDCTIKYTSYLVIVSFDGNQAKKKTNTVDKKLLATD